MSPVLRSHRQNTREGNWNLYSVADLFGIARNSREHCIEKNAEQSLFLFTDNNLFFRDYFFMCARKDLYRKNDFTKISKNLDINTDLKIILGYQNNYVGNSNMISNTAKHFGILIITSLNILYNYSDSPIKLVSVSI